MTIKLELYLKNKLEHYNLTNREKEVASYWMMDYSSKEIAETLFLSDHTVKSVLKSINRKMEVSTKASLILKVLEENYEKNRKTPY